MACPRRDFQRRRGDAAMGLVWFGLIWRLAVHNAQEERVR